MARRYFCRGLGGKRHFLKAIMKTLHHLIQNCDTELLSRINQEVSVPNLLQLLPSATEDEAAIIRARVEVLTFLVA